MSTKARTLWAVASLMLGLSLFPVAAGSGETAQGLSAKDILLRAQEKQFPKNSVSEITMTLIGRGGDQRIRKILTKRKEGPDGENKSVAYFLSPADVKGTAFLVWEHKSQPNDIFLYLPALKKIRRIAGEQKRQSFMGSDFSYADMESRDVDEAEHRILGEETLDGHAVWVIESVPKPESDSEYGKLISRIRKEDFIPQKVEFYDKKSKLYKMMEVLRVGPVGQEVLPLHFTMHNVQTDHKTEILLENVQLGQDIPDDEFTHRAIQR